MKNILILTGSPRIGGNSDLMADAFQKGAESAGHKVIRYEAGTQCDPAMPGLRVLLFKWKSLRLG